MTTRIRTKGASFQNRRMQASVSLPKYPVNKCSKITNAVKIRKKSGQVKGNTRSLREKTPY